VFDFSGAHWARQDCPSALRGLDAPGALPKTSQLPERRLPIRFLLEIVPERSDLRGDCCGAVGPSDQFFREELATEKHLRLPLCGALFSGNDTIANEQILQTGPGFVTE
jgi:hypothetical protein